jgi:pyruvate kinase
MAEAVRRFSNTIGDLPIPACMAGQVLEHMTEHPTPTRSEVCYLHDVLREGYRGVVLSDEAAIGRYPIESCRMAALFRD